VISLIDLKQTATSECLSEAALNQLTDKLLADYIVECSAQSSPIMFAVKRPFTSYWLPQLTQQEQSQQDRIVFYHLEPRQHNIVVSFAITDQVEKAEALLLMPDCGLSALRTQLSLAFIALTSPVRLETVAIAKPWGQEIWYTGIEQRGVSQISQNGSTLDLPFFLACGFTHIMGTHETKLTLLKILDPLPEPVFGDLYFELHQKKQEVYVVTNVAATSWPDGKGAIRFGFSAEKFDCYADEEDFKSAYLRAVKNYEKIRREIDGYFDIERNKQGFALNEPVAVSTLKEWQKNLPAKLVESEILLRAQMDSFTQMLPLQQGDVVRVPCYVPHALQHGVRTVEFQTPVYERQILSFCQKVLTQDHWNTQQGLRMAHITSKLDNSFAVLNDDECAYVERIVDFDDFEVHRVKINSAQRYSPAFNRGYMIVMVVEGRIEIGGELVLINEEASLIGQLVCNRELINLQPDQASLCLIAIPKL